jgi:lipoate-protein ligase A
MNWRLLTEDGVSASSGRAVDETLAARVGRGLSPPTLRLYTYRSHCALVGRFQAIEHEVHLPYCERHGIDVCRRPTGGGAIIMGSGQLGIALVVPGRDSTALSRPRALLARFSEGLSLGLSALGIRASFRGKNDLEVRGRKLAGLGLCRHPAGGLLFHASLLVDLDVPLMLRVLRIPIEKLTGKEISTVAARTSTVRRELGREIGMDEVRAPIAAGFTAAFDVALHPGVLSTEERDAAAVLERDRYCSPEWVFQSSPLNERTGAARVQTPGGILDFRVALSGGMMKAVSIRGDFIAGEEAVAGLEAQLRWHPVEPDAVMETVRKVLGETSFGFGAVPAESLASAIVAAAANAREAAPDGKPYGCFVTPRSALG